MAAALAIGAIDGFEPLADALAAHPTTMPDDRTPGSLFVYTSGTTGRPKGIRRQHEAGDPDEVANAAAVFGRAFDFVPFSGPHLVSTAMYHGGSHSYYMGALNVGHPLVIMPRFDAETALQLIERHRVFSAYMVPTQFHRLLQLPDDIRARYDVSSLHAVVHSAAPCPLEVKRRMMAWWGPDAPHGSPAGGGRATVRLAVLSLGQTAARLEWDGTRMCSRAPPGGPMR